MEKRKDTLWILFFIIIFINGFEAAGYQASLWDIGQTYELSTTKMGLFASVELFATMLAPLVLGAWADRNNKIKCLKILLGIQLVAALVILLLMSRELFVGGTFFLGLTTSATQFITIAALADNYPISGKNKIGYMTSMYAFGAFVAPLIVSFYLRHGFHWKTLFAFLTVGSAIVLAGLFLAFEGPREVTSENVDNSETKGQFILLGILFLCVIMCIYVGFENGFAFFVDTLFKSELNSNIGKYALSVFWIVMIPSRALVGTFEKYSSKILLAAVIAIPCITIIISMLSNSFAVLVLCVPLGFACGAIYPSVLNTLIPLAGKKTATATGMITTATGLGGFAFTALTGYLADLYGMRLAITILASFFVISLIAVILEFSLKKKIRI